MRSSAVFLFLFFAIKISAQITLTQANVPAPGDTLFYARDTLAASFSVGEAGANRFWDFSQLIVEETYQLIATDTVGDPNAAAYPGANLIISSEGLNTYLYSSDTAVYLLGGGLPEAAEFGLDGIVFDVPQKLYQFPSTYGTSFTSFYSVDATVDGSIFLEYIDSIRLVRRTSGIVEIDAFGTIKTPYNNYDALRQRTKTTNYDSVYVQYLGLWVPFGADTSTNIEYQWLTAEAKGSVVTAYIDEATGQVSSIEFFLDVQNANAPTAAFIYEDQGGGSLAFTDQSGNEPLSWQWTFGDGESSSEQNPTHVYSTSGDYQVCLTAANIVGTSQICQQITVDVLNSAPDPTRRADINVYPNPTDRYVNIFPEGLEQQTLQLTLFDLRGQMVRQVSFTGQTRLDLQSLPAGLYGYFIQAADGSRWSSGKLQINK
ncbi:MAG: PKD domain-containing protein [Saprospiraceae bacterium]|nr:PKD domain-containing protein [Lewinella sp.]